MTDLQFVALFCVITAIADWERLWVRKKNRDVERLKSTLDFQNQFPEGDEKIVVQGREADLSRKFGKIPFDKAVCEEQQVVERKE